MNPNDLGEKTNYSYDEMMSQLRRQRSSGRGRKRRTKQPKKKKWSLSTKFVVIAFAVSGLMLVALAAVLFTMHLRHGSDGFRRKVGAEISQLSGHRVEISKMSVSGTRVTARDSRSQGPDDSLIRETSMSRAVGKLGIQSFFGDVWGVDSLQVYDMEVVLDLPSSAGEATGEASPPVPATLDAAGGLGLSATPEAIRLAAVQLANTEISWGKPLLGAPLSQLRDVSFYGDVFGEQTTFRGTGGEFEWHGMTWGIDTIAGESKGSDLVIERSRLTAGRGGEIALLGTVDLRPSGQAKFHGTVQDVSLGEILADYWKQRIIGAVNATFDYSMTFAPGEVHEVQGDFTIDKLGVSDLPVFDSLAVYVAAPEFNYVEFQRISGKFSHIGGAITISDFDAHRPGLVRLRGEIRVGRERELSGEVNVGIPEASFLELGGIPELFSLREDGFAWSEMTLSGTVDEPQDDLADKIRAELQERAKGRLLESESSVAPGVQRGSSAPGNPIMLDPGQSLVPASPPTAPPSQPAATREEQLEQVFEELIR